MVPGPFKVGPIKIGTLKIKVIRRKINSSAADDAIMMYGDLSLYLYSYFIMSHIVEMKMECQYLMAIQFLKFNNFRSVQLYFLSTYLTEVDTNIQYEVLLINTGKCF